jgi:hypothetical protein
MPFTDKDIAIILILCILLISFSFRRYLSRLNFLSLFFFATLIFNSLTLIVWGFDRSYFITAFTSFNLNQITTESYLKSSVIIIGGLLIVFFSYMLADLASYRGTLKFRSLFNILPKAVSPYLERRIIVLSIAVAAIHSVLIVRSLDDIIHGFILGFIGGDHAVIMDTRQDLNSSYIFFVWSVNILPFMCVSLYALSRILGRYRAYAWLYIAFTAFSILCTFFKTHLIIFIGLLFLVRINTGVSAARTPGQLFSAKNIKYLGVLFGLIVGLYALFGIARQESSLIDIALSLGETATSRIVGRLGISILMYGHYFPDIGDHYGFTNLNIFAKLFGYEVYFDTREVFKHFSTMGDGSVAINSTMDFFGAFGWPGWIVGCTLLGIGINFLDRKLISLDNNLPNFVLKLYGLVFIYYLTQASVFRAALGYGGLFFLVMWLAMRLSMRQKKRAVQDSESLSAV